MEKRIQVIIASHGVCSRRAAEKLITQGKVTLNGKLVSLGMSADEEKDLIVIDGEKLRRKDRSVYIMLNKPVGYITSMSDQRQRKTVTELVADAGVRVHPVGRLDLRSNGLLLMTNDGNFTYKMTHPSHEVEKEYIVRVTGDAENNLDKLSSGLVIDGYKTRPAKAQLLERDGDTSVLRITIREGRNRQVRKMCAVCGLKVLSLTRTAVGSLRLGGLENGKWRYITEKEVAELKKQCDIK